MSNSGLDPVEDAGRFASEEEALRFVQRALDEEGDAYADNLELAIGEAGTRNLSGTALTNKAHSLPKQHEATQPRGSLAG